jgi:hypothetical protein
MMANDRLRFAIGRLERATGRIERIMAESAPAPTIAVQADPQFAKRHEQLRNHVKSAISRIDALIAAGSR